MTASGADARALNGIRQALQEAENAADADAAASLLAGDAVLMVPDFPVQEGRAACLEFMREMLGWLSANFERHIVYESAEIMVIGDVAFDRGTFAFTASPRSGGETERVTGKYLWLLARTAAEPWRITRLIVSRDDASDEHESESDAPPHDGAAPGPLLDL